VSRSVSCLSPAQLRDALGVRDLSDPAAGPHAIQLLAGRAAEALSRAWSCEVRWCRGPDVVPVADNYDRLGYAAGAITREARYTRYVSASRMLRSHSTAMIPPALRQLARDRQAAGDTDVLLACPGMAYRRDAIDWQHTGTPHQLDLWRITSRPMTDADLDEMISGLLGARSSRACRTGRSRGSTRIPSAAARSTYGMTAAGWRSGSAVSPTPACWPPPGWPAAAAWPWAWASTAC
jgi:phenylalanyl-tRNA synthetase alpha chain